MSVEYVSPPARIVWGHPSKSKVVIDDRTKQPKLKKDGTTQRREITFGLAISKQHAQSVFDAMQAAAKEKYPNGTPENFAWKFKDGDTGKDGKGNPLNAKEGYAGCIILSCRTELDSVGNFEFDHGQGKWIECGTIKCGDWVNVKIGFDAHISQSMNEKPGLYVNPNAVMLHHRDKEIQGGAFDPNAAGFAPPPPQEPPANAPLPGQPQQSQPHLPTQHNGTPLPGPAMNYVAPQQPNAGPAPSPHTQFLNGPRPDQ